MATDTSDKSMRTTSKNASQDQTDQTNYIKKCIQSHLDTESFVKFQQLLEYINKKHYTTIYQEYNANLFSAIVEFQKNKPPDYPHEQYIQVRAKYYSFLFFKNIGQYIIERLNEGSPKAERNLLTLAKILLYHGLTAKSDTANLALVEFEQLFLNCGMSLQDTYFKYRTKFLRLIIKAILGKLMVISDDDRSNGGNDSTSNGSGCLPNKSNLGVIYMTRALEVFNIAMINSEDVAQSLIITTNLIHKEIYDDSIRRFLEYLASYQNIDIHTLIKSHIQAILVSLLLRKKLSHFDITASLNKLSSFCGKTPKDLLTTKFTLIKGRLILNYSIDAKSVTDGIYYLSKFEKEEHDQPFEEELDDENYFIEYLSPSMIGILLGIDSYLMTIRKDFGSDESIKYVTSISKLISLVNTSQIDAIHVKLLSTLSLLINLRPNYENKPLSKSIVDAWTIFVSKLSRDLKVNLLINICVVLKDLIDDCPSEVSNIYEDLICQNQSPNLKDQFKSLFFIPNIPSLYKVYEHLTPFVKRGSSTSNLLELQEYIECVRPLVRFENQRSRCIALCRIKELLQSNQDLLITNMLMNQGEPLDNVISHVIELLLALSPGQDAEGTTLIAESLGIIGAINPVRLDHLIYGELQEKRSVSIIMLTDPTFIVSLVERLKISLLSNQSESEAANYALQVIIKNFPILNEPRFREKLSEEAIRACQLCQNTSYSGSRKTKADFTSSVYQKLISENNYCYKDWLDKFSLNLFSSIKDKRIQDTLYACSYVFRFNLKLAEFLLPHAVTHIIINQPTHGMIKREIESIIEEDVGVSTQDLDDLRSGNAKGNQQTLHIQCANIIFCILDAVHRLNCDASGLRPAISLKGPQNRSLKEFIDDIPKDKLALLASRCRAHVRALYYFEQFLLAKSNQLNDYATELQKIHVALDDPYEASGIEMVRTRPTTILDDVSNYEACGRFDKAFICSSTVLDSLNEKDDCGSIIEDSLRCLSNHGDYQRLFEKSRQMLHNNSRYKRHVLPYMIEASWKLSKWDELNQYFKHHQTNNILDIAPVSQGLLLNSLKTRDEISSKLRIVRYELMRPLSIALIDRSAYFRGYQNLLVLHSIGDFALCSDLLGGMTTNLDTLDENTAPLIIAQLHKKLEKLFCLWDKRNKLVQPSLRGLEPILEWQRSICIALTDKFPLAKDKIDIQVAKLWLKSADSARDARSFDRSFFCITQARRWFGPSLEDLDLNLRLRYHIEQAKLDWDQGDQTKAIRGLKLTLQRMKEHGLYKHLETRRSPKNHDPFPQLNNLPPCNDCSTFDKSERESFAQLKMLLTQYSEESASEIPETLFFMYEECVHLGVNQEETYFRLARYYDKLRTYYIENPTLCGEQVDEKQALLDSTQRFSQNLVTGDKEEVYTKLMEHSIIAFGNSLKYGVAHLRESMPRLLNLWYDLGSRKVKLVGHTPRQVSSRIENTVRFIDELKSKVLPPYYFMTAISIILSRVNHPHSGISKKTCEILELLLANYPHQITWLMVALINDKVTENHDRNKAARTILNSCRRKGKEIEKVVRDTLDFSKLIIELCYSHSPKDPTRHDRERKKLTGRVHIKEISPNALKFVFADAKVVAPIQATIRAIIPFDTAGASPDKHTIFPEHNISYVRDFEPQVRIFNSLQQPRQVTLKCDNGRSVSIICKYGDDLRKDSRCIEFLNLLNTILRKDSQSNVRFLDIQTFLVLPLENEAGIIEMVPNCESFRGIIEPIYKERNSGFSMHDQFPRKEKFHANDLKEIFEKKVLVKTSPPVLPVWFLRKFTEPTSWYMARLAFTRSAAVSSMGGYIIGLGDRHLDNILVDTNTGKVVHVDFNLLFHQGESLQVPERVPFRLTHNMIAAFGPMGTEGNFRRVCEITMRVMRKEKDALLTTLKPFMHDPCTEWIKVRDMRNRLDQEDKHAENKSAKYRIEVTERKLKGYPRSRHFKPLTLIDSYSVEAQVDNLIAEASDNFNLAQMYYGWCPHV